MLDNWKREEGVEVIEFGSGLAVVTLTFILGVIAAIMWFWPSLPFSMRKFMATYVSCLFKLDEAEMESIPGESSHSDFSSMHSDSTSSYDRPPQYSSRQAPQPYSSQQFARPHSQNSQDRGRDQSRYSQNPSSTPPNAQRNVEMAQGNSNRQAPQYHSGGNASNAPSTPSQQGFNAQVTPPNPHSAPRGGKTMQQGSGHASVAKYMGNQNL